MRILDLFTGIGGFTLLLPRHSVALYVENNPFCQQVLQARMRDGLLPSADIHDDVQTLDPKDPRLRRVGLITAGFPCQGTAPMTPTQLGIHHKMPGFPTSGRTRMTKLQK